MSQRARILSTTAAVTIASSGTTASASPLVNGLIRALYVSAPTLTSSNTYTVAIIGGNNGQTLFSKASLTANAVTNILADANNYPLQVPVDDSCTVKITSSGTESSQRTFIVGLSVDRGAI